MTREQQFDDWLIYAAFLPALLALTSLGVTAAVTWHNPSLWQVATTTAIRSGADDYVAGLARLGIAKLPGYLWKSVARSSRRTRSGSWCPGLPRDCVCDLFPHLHPSHDRSRPGRSRAVLCDRIASGGYLPRFVDKRRITPKRTRDGGDCRIIGFGDCEFRRAAASALVYVNSSSGVGNSGWSRVCSD
jgi:hypothetical protein